MFIKVLSLSFLIVIKCQSHVLQGWDGLKMLQMLQNVDRNESNCLKKGTNVHLFSEILFKYFYFINWCSGHGHANLTDCI